MANLRPVLYGRWSSSCSWRVRNALEFKGIQYESRNVNLKQQKENKFLLINPAGQVPVLIHGRQLLTESMAIIEFLEEEYPMTPKLLGGDSYERSVIRTLSLNIIAGVQPFQNFSTVKFIDVNGWDSRNFVNHFVRKGLQMLEKRLLCTAGKYCVGDTISMADTCLVPQIFNATKKFDMDLSEFKLINELNKNLSKVPSFQRAHALSQSDAPTQVQG